MDTDNPLRYSEQVYEEPNSKAQERKYMKRKGNGTMGLLSYSLAILTYMHTVAQISTDKNWKHFLSNPLYRLNLTQSDSPFFSLLPKNIHLYIVFRLKSTQILTEC